MHEVIIIGAGFAGLSAAHALKAAGVTNFLLLEARGRTGGRIKPGRIAGLEVDFGGMWQGASQTRLMALADRYQVRSYATPLEGRNVFRLVGKEHHGDGERYASLFSFREALIEGMARGRLERAMRTLDCKAPWDHPDAERYDTLTVAQWADRSRFSQRLKSMYRLICLSVFCAEPSQVSLLFFMHYLKSGDGLDVLLSARPGGAQHRLFHGGLHQIARKMGDELGDRVRYESPVHAVTWAAEAVTVHMPEEAMRARRVIVAVPATLLMDIDFSPALPQPKAILHRRLNMGCAIKYWVAYDRPFWRDQGFNGMVVRDDTPASPCFDASPPDQPLGVIAGFFDADHAVLHGDIGPDARQRIVIDMLAEHFGPKAKSPLDYADTDWTTEKWSGGCYGAFAPPGVYARYGAWLRQPVGPLVWAGTETSPVWTGYVEGAIRSGEAAASQALSALQGEPPLQAFETVDAKREPNS